MEGIVNLFEFSLFLIIKLKEKLLLAINKIYYRVKKIVFIKNRLVLKDLLVVNLLGEFNLQMQKLILGKFLKNQKIGNYFLKISKFKAIVFHIIQDFLLKINICHQILTLQQDILNK